MTSRAFELSADAAEVDGFEVETVSSGKRGAHESERRANAGLHNPGCLDAGTERVETLKELNADRPQPERDHAFVFEEKRVGTVWKAIRIGRTII